jgi:hypothetical protein
MKIRSAFLELFQVYRRADGQKRTQAPKGSERTSKGLTEFFHLSVHPHTMSVRSQICEKL